MQRRLRKTNATTGRRRFALAPILEIEEDGVPVAEAPNPWSRPRWPPDDEPAGLQIDDWTGEVDE